MRRQAKRDQVIRENDSQKLMRKVIRKLRVKMPRASA
jgi:hypothetical protein